MQPTSSCRLCRSLAAVGRRVLSIESFGAFQGRLVHTHAHVRVHTRTARMCECTNIHAGRTHAITPLHSAPSKHPLTCTNGSHARPSHA